MTRRDGTLAPMLMIGAALLMVGPRIAEAQECGLSGEPCCDDVSCEDGLQCAEGACMEEEAAAPCGSSGQPCCSLGRCNSELQCESDVCRAEPHSTPTSGLSTTLTEYVGAILLRGNDQATYETVIGGLSEEDTTEATASWQGDTLYVDLRNPETGNSVNLMVEVYWFTSSVDRHADLYAFVFNLVSNPSLDGWHIGQTGDEPFLGSESFDRAQWITALMDPGGASGTVRWDASSPFQDWQGDQYGQIDMTTEASAGISLQAQGNGHAEVNGSAMKYTARCPPACPANQRYCNDDDPPNAVNCCRAPPPICSNDLGGEVTGNVQAQGGYSTDYRLSKHITINLYHWEMFVRNGAFEYQWELRGNEVTRPSDSQRFPYILVLQTTRGTPVEIPSLEFGADFKKPVSWGADQFEHIQGRIEGIRLVAPTPPCPAETHWDGATCAADEPPLPCALTTDCPEGSYCSDMGHCRTDCREDADCGGGTTCDDHGRCTASLEQSGWGCSSDIDCSEGNYCSVSGECTYDCTSDAECSDASMICSSRGQCTMPAGAAQDISDPAKDDGLCSLVPSARRRNGPVPVAVLVALLAIRRRRRSSY